VANEARDVKAIIALALCAGLGFRPALATTVVVPDDFPAVQSAIDSGADTVLVREGSYPERPVVDHAVVLQGIGVGQRPRLAGLDIVNTHFDVPSLRPLRVSSLAFSNRVEFQQLYGHPNLLDFEFSECSLDAGFRENGCGDPKGIGSLAFRNCRLEGPNAGCAEAILMEADTVSWVSWNAHVIVIRDCWFTGGAGVAMDLFTILDITLVNNLVNHYYDGIRFRAENGNAILDGNTITGCQGTAIEIPEVGNVALLRNNKVEDCGIGIHAMSMISRVRLEGNSVLRTTGLGVWAYPNRGVVAERNVVGDCGGAGIRLEWDAWGEGAVLMNNTVFDNAGSGIELIGLPIDPGARVEGNIGSGNGGWGLTVPEGGSVQLGCNDWFGNAQGRVQGVAVGATDLSVDPLFCDVQQGDVSLDSASPLLGAAGCGQIGALGVGCGETATLVQRFTAERVNDGVRVIWEVAEGATASEIWVERAEGMSDQAWAEPVTERSIEGRGVVELDRNALPDRTYRYRLVAREGGEVTVLDPGILVEAQVRLALHGFRPNPAFGAPAVAFTLADDSPATIEVLDVAGRRVLRRDVGRLGAGSHVIALDASARLAPGAYVMRLHQAGHTLSARGVVVK
jgi:hypothetical protein